MNSPNYRDNQPESAGEITSEERHASRRDRRRMETRERIYDAAMKLFAEKNFESVTIEMITESADVGKGTFFNYFENKEAVIRFQFEERLRMITLASAKILAGVEIENYPQSAKYFPKTGGVFWRRMVALVRFIAEHSEKNQRLTRTILALSLTNPAVRETSIASKKQASGVIVQLIQEGLNRGELRPDFTPEEMAHILYGAHISTLLQWAQTESETTLSEAIDHTFAVLWRALRNPNYVEEEPQERSTEVSNWVAPDACIASDPTIDCEISPP